MPQINIDGARFTPVRLRDAYDMGEVDRLLDDLKDLLAQLEDAVAGRGPAPAPLPEVRLSVVRMREGYHVAEVDAFLAQVDAEVAALRAQLPHGVVVADAPRRRHTDDRDTLARDKLGAFPHRSVRPGYARDEVDAYLDRLHYQEAELAERVEDLTAHNDALAAAERPSDVPTAGLGLAVHGPDPVAVPEPAFTCGVLHPGYSPAAVDAFLPVVQAQLEALARELVEQRRRHRALVEPLPEAERPTYLPMAARPAPDLPSPTPLTARGQIAYAVTTGVEWVKALFLALALLLLLTVITDALGG